VDRFEKMTTWQCTAWTCDFKRGEKKRGNSGNVLLSCHPLCNNNHIHRTELN